MPDKRLQDLEEENRRLDSTIARHVYRVLNNRETIQCIHKNSMKPNMVRKSCQKHHDVNSYSGNIPNTNMSIGDLDFDYSGLERSLLRQAQNVVRRMCQKWKDEPAETEQYESEAAIKIVDIFTSRGSEEKDIHVSEGDKDANNAKLIVTDTSVTQRSDSFDEYRDKSLTIRKSFKSEEFSLPEVRAALNCLNSFFYHKEQTHKISQLKTKFYDFIQEELFNRLNDENLLLDAAVGHATKRSRFGDAWGV